MSEIMTETDLDGHEDQADGAEVKARRAHRRVNPLPAEPVSASCPPANHALDSRRPQAGACAAPPA